jgi:hypothetical protein
LNAGFAVRRALTAGRARFRVVGRLAERGFPGFFVERLGLPRRLALRCAIVRCPFGTLTVRR